MKLVDSHCHLNHDYAPKSGDDLVREAALAGVETLVTVGTEISAIEQVAGLSERHPGVYHAIGIHPHEATGMKDEDCAILERAARHPKCRAIGEIGLDYHYDFSPREVQRARFVEQLDLALRVKLPVIVHSREAEEDLVAALTPYARKVPSGRIPGVIHCFTGTRAFGEACLALGFFISFSGVITFKNSDDLRTCARVFPLDRLMIETDSPYLAPVPFRGKKCEPSMVAFTAQKLAEIRGLSVEEIARVTTENAKRFFGLFLE
ncbi:MAG: hypothetical protein A2428_01765 [Bdellovibrionales bacterium RIFOXYC1_FULL_54_43]|nr:MAG: hypothetical protein A2428_01765 [Bdellovibrionales bacterium RIFOXYC1_FULL_54_43]OFZ78983.1 MAG: hypothetical protein A2603_10270 [Bdellovibrionales bacterium RIFOXYD1_FULL_55_31]